MSEQNLLGGTPEPTTTNRYRARDGLYYNGYMGSYDAVVDAVIDAFDECLTKIKESMGKELFGESK